MKEFFFFILIHTFFYTPTFAQNPTHILFEYIHRNYTYGFELNGMIVDEDGYVHQFNGRTKDQSLKFAEWNFGKLDPATQYYSISDSEVQENLGKCDRIICGIDSATLGKYKTMLYAIENSHTPPSKMFYDLHFTRGEYYLFGYIYKPETNSYTKILIEKHGNVTQYNTSHFVNDFKKWKWCKK